MHPFAIFYGLTLLFLLTSGYHLLTRLFARSPWTRASAYPLTMLILMLAFGSLILWQSEFSPEAVCARSLTSVFAEWQEAGRAAAMEELERQIALRGEECRG